MFNTRPSSDFYLLGQGYETEIPDDVTFFIRCISKVKIGDIVLLQTSSLFLSSKINPKFIFKTFQFSKRLLANNENKGTVIDFNTDIPTTKLNLFRYNQIRLDFIIYTVQMMPRGFHLYCTNIFMKELPLILLSGERAMLFH